MTDLAKKRWLLLGSILKKGRCQVNQDLTSVSVRRFSSFGLMATKVVPWQDVGVKPDCDEDGRQRLDIWYRYTCTLHPHLEALIRHLDSAFTLDHLLGFNNTGNVCVWPSEEILAYFCLKHSHRFNGKSVIELGGGMTCLAGVSLALCADPTEMLLTDGNEQSAKNLDVIVNKNNFRQTAVSSQLLRWNQHEKLGALDGHFDFVICADCLFFDEYREDLCSIILRLLKPGGEAVILAPSRNGTFWLFRDIVKEKFASVEVTEKYDNVVWDLHCKNKENGVEAYDENIHFPMLMTLKKQ